MNQRAIMSTVKTLNGLLRRYEAAPQRVRSYFSHVPGLARDYPLYVCLSYMFAKVEAAQNVSLYCGAVKLHRAHGELTWQALQGHHITRSEFQVLFEQIYGNPLPKEVMAPIKAAEAVRDKVMHGKQPNEAEKRNAIANVLEYAEKLNDLYRGATVKDIVSTVAITAIQAGG
jgi:hypothetical protein